MSIISTVTKVTEWRSDSLNLLIFFIPCAMMYQYEVLYQALVAQGIEQRIPVPCAGVRILSSALFIIRGTTQWWMPYDGRPESIGQPREESL